MARSADGAERPRGTDLRRGPKDRAEARFRTGRSSASAPWGMMMRLELEAKGGAAAPASGAGACRGLRARLPGAGRVRPAPLRLPGVRLEVGLGRSAF